MIKPPIKPGFSIRSMVLLLPFLTTSFVGNSQNNEYFLHPRRLTSAGQFSSGDVARSQLLGCRTYGCQPCTPEQLRAIARSVTVKIIGNSPSGTPHERGWGSGILIRKTGNIYTVLTNHHVLISSSSPHGIQTPDGHIYDGHLITSASFRGQDLALLQFQSENRNYAIAKFHPSSTLEPGDKVFGGGFPRNLEAGEVRPIASPRRPSEKSYPQKFYQFLRSPEFADLGFHLTRGRVSLLPEKPFERGYQIGYTNPIQKGMSGGPLLNRWGQVVGINGMHAYPLWGDPYVYQDGSQPPPNLREQMSRLAFAIPSDRFTQLAPEFSPPTGIAATADTFFFLPPNRFDVFRFPPKLAVTSCW